MNKTIPILLKEAKQSLNQSFADTINNCGLPMCCVTPIVKDLYEMCLQAEKQEYEAENTRYLKEKNENQEVD